MVESLTPEFYFQCILYLSRLKIELGIGSARGSDGHSAPLGSVWGIRTRVSTHWIYPIGRVNINISLKNMVANQFHRGILLHLINYVLR